jgi:hypothetical protein
MFAGTVNVYSTAADSGILDIGQNANMTISGGKLNLNKGGTIDDVGVFDQEGGTVNLASGASVDIASTGMWDLQGNFTIGGTSGSTITNDGVLVKSMGTGIGTVRSYVENDEEVVSADGTLKITDGEGGNGLDIIADATLEYAKGVSSGQTVEFLGVGDTLSLLNPNAFYGTINDFNGTDKIKLKGSWRFDGLSGGGGYTQLILKDGTETATLNFLGDPGPFNVATGKTSTTITV